MIELPRHHLGTLEALAAAVLERRGADGPPDTLARDLLAGFYDACMRAGLDGVLVALERAFAPLELVDESALSEDRHLRSDLAERLRDRRDFDPRGPRNAMPRQLAECLLKVLSLALHDPPARTITLSDEVRRNVVGALRGVVDVELVAPKIRASIIATGRDLCPPRHLISFDRIAAQLDERGSRFPPQPSMALAAVQTVQRMLFEARMTVVERAAHAAIDRAREVLESASAEAAARIGRPISHRLTPRDVAVRRAGELRVTTPEVILESLVASLTELAELAWQPPTPLARTYSASETYASGDLIDHPRFGRGTVHAAAERTIEVEFADGWHTLVHARARR